MDIKTYEKSSILSKIKTLEESLNNIAFCKGVPTNKIEVNGHNVSECLGLPVLDGLISEIKDALNEKIMALEEELERL